MAGSLRLLMRGCEPTKLPGFNPLRTLNEVAYDPASVTVTDPVPHFVTGGGYVDLRGNVLPTEMSELLRRSALETR